MPRWGLVKIEGEFHDRKTTLECMQWRQNSSAKRGEDGKWALCVHTTFVHAPRTHIWRTAKLSDKAHKHWIHLQLHFVPQLYHKTARVVFLQAK